MHVAGLAACSNLWVLQPGKTILFGHLAIPPQGGQFCTSGPCAYSNLDHSTCFNLTGQSHRLHGSQSCNIQIALAQARLLAPTWIPDTAQAGNTSHRAGSGIQTASACRRTVPRTPSQNRVAFTTPAAISLRCFLLLFSPPRRLALEIEVAPLAPASLTRASPIIGGAALQSIPLHTAGARCRCRISARMLSMIRIGPGRPGGCHEALLQARRCQPQPQAKLVTRGVRAAACARLHTMLHCVSVLGRA